MEHAGLILAARALAACEIQVEKITGGYRLVVEGESRSFRSSPTPSKAKAEAARSAFEEFADWSASSADWIKRAGEDSGSEMREEVAMEFADVIRKRAGEQILTPEQKPAGRKNGERREDRPQERSENPESPGTQAAEEPSEEAAAYPAGKPDVKERKDPQWRRKEVKRILHALSQARR